MASKEIMRPQDRALIAPLLSRLGAADALTGDENAAITGCVTAVEHAAARTVLTAAGVHVEESKLLLDGFVSRQRELPDGRRQILALHVPGEFVDLHSLVLKSLDHAVVALAPVRFAVVPHARLREITEREPHLARLLWFATAVDAAVHREWIASTDRSAAGRVAHIFCELRQRLAVVGLADAGGYALPLTQIDVADATSLTPVHVNRTLRQLREAGVVDFRSGRVEIGDLAALERIAGFDPGYLYLDSRPR